MKAKYIIAAASIAAILGTTSARADIINGQHVTRQDDNTAIADNGDTYKNDGGEWYNQTTGTHGIIEPDAPIITEPTKPTTQTESTTEPPKVLPEQKTPQPIIATDPSSIDKEPTTSTAEPKQTDPQLIDIEPTQATSTTETKTVNAGKTATESTKKTATVNAKSTDMPVTIEPTTITAATTEQRINTATESEPAFVGSTLPQTGDGDKLGLIATIAGGRHARSCDPRNRHQQIKEKRLNNEIY